MEKMRDVAEMTSFHDFFGIQEVFNIQEKVMNMHATRLNTKRSI